MENKAESTAWWMVKSEDEKRLRWSPRRKREGKEEDDVLSECGFLWA